MTVSRALRNSPRVTPPLRKRVQKIAAALGYRPDPEVTKLMNHLRRRDKAQLVASIAAITSISEGETSPQHQLNKVWGSARRRAEELGYRLELFRVSEPDRFNRQLERTLVNRGVEGVLLMQMRTPTSVEHFLNWEKFSAAVASPSVLTPDFPRVEVNYFHNARLLCERLAQRGCRRIGFVGSRTFCVRTNEAFSAAVAWQGLVAGEEPVRPLVVAEIKEVGEAIAPWLRQERPDAVIAYSEQVLPQIFTALRQHRSGAIPVTCTSVNMMPSLCAGIDERHEMIGRKAVDVLTGMLNRNEKNLRATNAGTFIDGLWVEAEPASKRKVKTSG